VDLEAGRPMPLRKEKWEETSSVLRGDGGEDLERDLEYITTGS